MPIPLSCACGRAFNIKDECAGHKIRCPQCKSVLNVPVPNQEDEPEEFDLEILEDDKQEEIELDLVEDDKPEEDELEVVEDEEEEVPEVLPAEPQTRRSSIQATPARRPARLSSSEDDERVQTRRRRDEDEDEPQPKRRRPKLRREEARGPSITFERGWFGSTNAGVLGGLLMILIAVVWFVLGLAANRIFFYPPILFIIGVIAVIKGLAGG